MKKKKNSKKKLNNFNMFGRISPEYMLLNSPSSEQIVRPK